MKVLNFGSLNLDFVYAVPRIVQPGETLTSKSLETFYGGKGLNQSIALARAGAVVHHAGMIGPDGDMLLEAARKNGVGVAHIRRVEERTGNAIIQVDATGQNSIILFGGANRANDDMFINKVLDDFSPGDFLLLQNEINLIDRIIECAWSKGMVIALNPAPFDDNLSRCDLGKVSLFIMNEVEGTQLTGETEANQVRSAMREKYPGAEVVLTLGGAGAAYRRGDEHVEQGIFPVEVVDTTAAGDTFIGYFLAARMEGLTPIEAMRLAARASSIVVSRVGAATSIPRREEVTL